MPYFIHRLIRKDPASRGTEKSAARFLAVRPAIRCVPGGREGGREGGMVSNAGPHTAVSQSVSAVPPGGRCSLQRRRPKGGFRCRLTD